MDLKTASKIVSNHQQKLKEQQKQKRRDKMYSLIDQCYKIDVLHEYVRIFDVKDDRIIYEEIKIYSDFNLGINLNYSEDDGIFQSQLLNEIYDFKRAKRISKSKYFKIRKDVLKKLHLQDRPTKNGKSE
jgi:hypothetical protein